MSDLAAGALAYASRGWPIFPLVPWTKRPYAGSRGLHATTDPHVTAARWARHPQANIGIRTGLTAGLVVIDLDQPDGPRAWMALVQAHEPREPVTLRALTPRGGVHLYFQHPEDISEPIRNSAGKLGPGIDVRGEGGLVVAPPSQVAGGGRYWWDGPASEPGPLPAWLLELVQPAPGSRPPGRPATLSPVADRYLARVLADELAALRAAPEGNRNHAANRAAWKVGRVAHLGDAGELRSALVAAAMDAGLPDREARRAIASGFEAGMRRARELPAPPSPERGRS